MVQTISSVFGMQGARGDKGDPGAAALDHTAAPLYGVRADAGATDIAAAVNAILTELRRVGAVSANPMRYSDLAHSMVPRSYWRLGESSGTVVYDDGPVVADAYTTKGTMALGSPDLGPGAWAVIENDASARLSIIGGKLTNTATAAASRAGYASQTFTTNVRRIGGRFTLSPNTNPGGGVAAFVIWKTPLTNLAVLPDSPLHLIVSDIGWALEVYESGVPRTPAGGGNTFLYPLATDGLTVHEVDVAIDGTTAIMRFPDGSTATITDAAIGTNAGPNACYEVYQGNAATDTKAAFTETWATSVGVSNGAYAGSPVLGKSGALVGDRDTAVTFNVGGSINGITNGPLGVGDFSLLMWVRRNDASAVDLGWTYGTGPAHFCSYSIAASENRLHVGITTNAGVYSDHYGSLSSSPSPGTLGSLADMNWHHLVVVRSGTTIKIATDGLVFTSPTACGSGAIDMDTVRLNAALFAAGTSTNTLDEVMLFTRALTNAEIRSLWQRGSGAL